jgi:excisionase family DNA binding protein
MTQRTLPEQGLLTTKQVARLLQVSVRTVWRYLRGGRLPRPRYVGPRSPRWLRAEIDARLSGEGGDA